MKPSLELETKKFDQVLKQWLAGTTRELSVAINARMAFTLIRAFVLIPPHRVQEQRDKIRAYLTAPVGTARQDKATGKKVGKSRILRRIHLIAQAAQRKAGGKGLYGADMRKAASSKLRRAVGSIGYLKSGLIVAIKRFNGHFGQYGRAKKVSRSGKVTQTEMQPNGAFIKMLNQYGITSGIGNVAKHKGVVVRTWPSKASISSKSLSAAVELSIGVKDNQLAKVESVYSAAMERAFRDERAEMEQVIRNRLDAAAQEAVDANK